MKYPFDRIYIPDDYSYLRLKNVSEYIHISILGFVFENTNACKTYICDLLTKKNVWISKEMLGNYTMQITNITNDPKGLKFFMMKVKDAKRYGDLCHKADFLLNEVKEITPTEHENIINMIESSDQENMTVAETIIETYLNPNKDGK